MSKYDELARFKAYCWKRLLMPVKRIIARAKAGDVDAACRLAESFMNRRTPAGYRAAIPWLRKAARAGERWAEYSLGLIFDHGWGTKRNVARAMEWYSKAAGRGYDSAQLNLGILLANLPGKRRDLASAIRLYRTAARNGNRNAMYNLGLYYKRGRGVRRSLRLANFWYGKAAAAGDRHAKSIVKKLQGLASR